MKGYQPTEKIDLSKSVPKGGSSGIREEKKTEIIRIIDKLIDEVRENRDIFATVGIFEHEISISICPWEEDKESEE